MSSLKVTINDKLITDGMLLPLDIAQKQTPKFEFSENAGKFYTILMVDPDAPSPTNPIYKYWLHMLIINTNQIIVPYNPPDPPGNSGKHRYYICLYEQPMKINKDTINIRNNDFSIKRKNFQLDDFVNKYGLKKIASVYFTTENKKTIN
jgi:large subunit ribosomal protein L35